MATFGQAITARIADRLIAAKASKPSLGMFLQDYTKIGDNSAKMLVGSASEITPDAVRDFVFESTNNKMIPMDDSIVIKEDKVQGYCFASVIAYRAPIVHQEATPEVVKKMTKVSASTYLDESLGTTWQKQEADGKCYFIRQNVENLEEVLRTARYGTMTASIRASVNVESSIPTMNIGDTAEIFAMDEGGNTGKALGKIDKIDTNTNMVDVTIGEGTDAASVSVPASAIMRVVPIQAANSKKEVIDFLMQSYPEGYKQRLKDMK